MISFTSVTKRYGPQSAPAVDDVSFSVNKGEFFALLGPNGAGKTTLVKMLLDFVRPTHGAIAMDGVITKNPLSRSGVGYLPENVRLPPHLSGRRFLKRHAELCGMSVSAAAGKIDEVLETVGMNDKGGAAAKTYSKGMLQRIGLAAALLTGDKLLVLDEPVSGLDPIGIRDVRRIMETVKQKGVTIILNSHLLSEVEKTCDTAAIIDKGKIALKGRIADIVRDNETLEDVFMRVVGASHA
jgi:ABC-2 type transport system ATP-binding protein